jgi:hypothetical protein
MVIVVSRKRPLRGYLPHLHASNPVRRCWLASIAAAMVSRAGAAEQIVAERSAARA